MKKIYVMAAVLALLATPALALIEGTKHDFRSTNGNATVKADQSTEICVYCHTPHGAITNSPNTMPLWNRSHVGADYVVAGLYNSSTLNQTYSNPTTVLSVVNGSDAKLCMSCHDGASLSGGLQNPANSEGGVQPTFSPANVGANANLGTTLVNDHPIGMDYTTLAGVAGEELNTPITASLPLYGASNNIMWCSTCHDVHDNSKGTPFLNTSNAASALCLVCHVK